jgi:hypothetical protein
MEARRHRHAGPGRAGAFEQIAKFFRLVGEFQRRVDFLGPDEFLVCFGQSRLASQNLPEFIVSLGAFRLFAQDLPHQGLSLLVVTVLNRLLNIFGRREGKRHCAQEGKGSNQERLGKTFK